ncbi:hypothetical protein AnigIFM56816_010479 [Aspergillus niger]|nr:hypothetical protein AnigIFM56816_010479 [Aspergillus niger]
MEESLAPFLQYTEKDRRSDAPAFSLALQGPKKLSRTAPYLFHVTLQRVDEVSQYCVFAWYPQTHGFATSNGFILLHHTAQGELHPVTLPEYTTLPQLEHWHFSPYHCHKPSNVQQYYDVIPDRFIPYLQTGERYVLLWPGQQYGSWNWTDKVENSKVVLPGGPFLSFTVEDDENRPIVPTLISGAQECCPTLIARIECCPQSKVALQDDLVLATLHVTYLPTSGSGGRPFTFNTAGLNVGLWVWRDRWVNLKGFVCGGGWAFVDDPDMQVSPGRDKGFASLRPGETWSEVLRIPLLTDMESNDGGEARIGEGIRCLFKGLELDWWVWGSREDLLETTVTIPATGSWTVREPGEQPNVFIPAAAPVDLEIV